MSFESYVSTDNRIYKWLMAFALAFLTAHAGNGIISPFFGLPAVIIIYGGAIFITIMAIFGMVSYFSKDKLDFFDKFFVIIKNVFNYIPKNIREIGLYYLICLILVLWTMGNAYPT